MAAATVGVSAYDWRAGVVFVGLVAMALAVAGVLVGDGRDA
jgi:hypothetical protein